MSIHVKDIDLSLIEISKIIIENDYNLFEIYRYNYDKDFRIYLKPNINLSTDSCNLFTQWFCYYFDFLILKYKNQNIIDFVSLDMAREIQFNLIELISKNELKDKILHFYFEKGVTID